MLGSRRKQSRKAAPLHAKLLRPRPAYVQPRQRLLDRLDALASHPLIWIDGPAGAGKTTLAASYVEHAGGASVWYRIDASDADPATLFHHLATAVRGLSPALEHRLPPLTADHLATIGTYTQEFFVQACRGIRRRLVFVFDGFEAVGDAPGAPAVLLHAADVLPERARILVLSRRQPGAEFARARLHRSFARIDAAELRMTEQEVAAVAAARGGGRLTADQLEQARRTWIQADGWVAGVILLLAAGRTELAGARLGGIENRQPLFDYFAQEVFERIDETARATLLAIADLPFVTAPLVEALTGSPGRGAVLGELHRQNYFISCAADGATYRLHPLFREFLAARQRLALTAPEQSALRRRCADLLEAAGEVDEALASYRAVPDWEHVARLVLQRAPTWAARSQLQTLGMWVSQLPAEVVDGEPWLLYWRGVCRTMLAPADARRDLERAYDGFDRRDLGDGLYAAWSAIVATLFAEWSDFSTADHWVATFEDLHQRHPRPAAAIEPRVACAVVCVLSHRYLHHPHLDGWLPRAEELVRTGAAASGPAWLELCLVVVLQHMWTGHIEKVGPLVRLIETAASDTGHSPAFRVAALNVLAISAWVFDDPAAAERLVREALDLTARHDLAFWRHQLLGQGVIAAVLGGDHARARAYLTEMLASAEAQPGKPLFWGHLHWTAAVEAIDGHPGAAREHAESGLQKSRAASFTFGIACNLVAAANAAFLCGARDDAAAYLAEATRQADRSRSLLLEFYARLTEAAWAVADDRTGADPELLRATLAMSRKLRGVAVPGIARALLADLYAVALERGIEGEHLTAQIARFSLAPPAAAAGDAWPFPIKIHTLGRFTVLRDGAPLRFAAKAQKRPLALLKAMIARGGRDVSERELCDLLWPDAEADLAHQNLRATIHRARMLVGTDAIAYQAGRLALDGRRCWVDTWAVERRLNAMLDAPADATARDLAAPMETVLRLYQGPFLSGDDDFVLGLRDRLRIKLGLAALRMARVLEHEGRPGESIRCLERALDAEPNSEELYEQLMRVHLAQRQPSRALSAYERCRTQLRRAGLAGPSRDAEALRAAAARALVTG